MRFWNIYICVTIICENPGTRWYTLMVTMRRRPRPARMVWQFIWVWEFICHVFLGNESHGWNEVKLSTNSSNAAKPSVAGGKKPYLKPAVRHEQVFETMALRCGKLNVTQSSCHFNRKVS